MGTGRRSGIRHVLCRVSIFAANLRLFSYLLALLRLRNSLHNPQQLALRNSTVASLKFWGSILFEGDHRAFWLTIPFLELVRELNRSSLYWLLLLKFGWGSDVAWQCEHNYHFRVASFRLGMIHSSWDGLYRFTFRFHLAGYSSLSFFLLQHLLKLLSIFRCSGDFGHSSHFATFLTIIESLPTV